MQTADKLIYNLYRIVRNESYKELYAVEFCPEDLSDHSTYRWILNSGCDISVELRCIIDKSDAAKVPTTIAPSQTTASCWAMGLDGAIVFGQDAAVVFGRC